MSKHTDTIVADRDDAVRNALSNLIENLEGIQLAMDRGTESEAREKSLEACSEFKVAAIAQGAEVDILRVFVDNTSRITLEVGFAHPSGGYLESSYRVRRLADNV